MGVNTQSFRKAAKSYNNNADWFRQGSEPDNPRQNMESSDMEPDDARQFIADLMNGIHNRMNEMPDDEFAPERKLSTSHNMAKQYYGNDEYQLLSGIQAALREWDESGREIDKLKEQYGGRFVDGVEIGERLAVYSGSDFQFSEGSDSEESKFTFVQ